MEPDIELTFPPDLLRLLTELEQRVQRREPLMVKIAGIMMDAVDENFVRGGRPAWEPLKSREGQPLMLSGQLHHSIQPWTDNDNAFVGTNVIYARIQQLGGETRPHVIRPRNKKALYFNGRFAQKVNHPGSVIPARPFLAMTEADYDLIRQAIGDHIAGFAK